MNAQDHRPAPATADATATGRIPRPDDLGGHVPGNRWDLLEAPELGTWVPEQTLSVVVPCYEARTELELTLAALAAQSYPPELTQVVVVDDGSDPPITVPADAVPGELVVRRQERRGFGAGRARQAGLEAADGELVVFLDADILAEPGHLEAHARWHHLVDDAATLGVRRFVDTSGLTAGDVAEAAAAGSLATLFADRPSEPHTWIEEKLARTDDLTRAPGDEWRVVVGASLGVGRTLLDELGRLPVFGVRGTEDTVLGYRLHTRGALLVCDRQAQSWHQGPRSLDDPARKAAVLAERAPLLANELPVPWHRPDRPGHSWRVPSVAVTVPVDEATDPDAAVRAVTAVLAGSFSDLVIAVAGPPETPARRWVEAWFPADPRVLAVDDAASFDALHRFAPIRVILPPHAVVGPSTIGRIVDALARHEFGTLHLTVPGHRPREGLVEAMTTRASRRAARLAPEPDRAATLRGELFGERWEAGEAYGLAPSGEAAAVADAWAGAYAGWGANDLARRLSDVEADLASLRGRRVVAVANAAGGLRHARTPRELLAVLRRVAGAMLGRHRPAT